MSGYDPFYGNDDRNILKHIIAPKIVGPTAGQYQVAVDLVNIDTLYVNNIVSSGGGSGGVGPTGPTGPAGSGAGSTGATGPTGTFIYTGVTAGILYYDGATVVNNAELTYIDSTNTLNVPNIILEKVGGVPNNTIRVTTETTDGRNYIQSGYTNIPESGGILDIGRMYDTGVPTVEVNTDLQRVGIAMNDPAYTLDVAGQTHIKYDGASAANITSLGASGATGTYTASVPGTYTIQAWGQGGFSNGGNGGGGGYATATVTVPAGNTGIFTWGQTGGGVDAYGAQSGGNATYVMFTNVGGQTGYVLWAPGGGGAGPTGTSGAPYSESGPTGSGLPTVEGGLSSDGTTGGAGGTAIYADSTNGSFAVAGHVLPITPTIPTQIFGPTPGQIDATFGAGQGATITINGTYTTNVVIPTYTDIILPFGTTATLSGVSATFTSPVGIENFTFPQSVPVTNESVTLSTFVPGTVPVGTTAFALVDPYSSPTGIVASGDIYGTTGTISLGSVTTVNATFASIGATAIGPPLTIRVYPAGAFDNSNPGTFVLSNNSSSTSSIGITGSASVFNIVSADSISTTATISVIDATLPVIQTNYVYHGNNGVSQLGATGPIGMTGGAGGGGWFGGGGAAFGPSGIQSPLNEYSGGGAGGATFGTAIGGATISSTDLKSASGIYPYVNGYNVSGQYGRGATSASAPPSGWAVIEASVVGPTGGVPALYVEGNGLFTGSLTTNTSLTVGPTGTATLTLRSTSPGPLVTFSQGATAAKIITTNTAGVAAGPQVQFDAAGNRNRWTSTDGTFPIMDVAAVGTTTGTVTTFAQTTVGRPVGDTGIDGLLKVQNGSGNGIGFRSAFGNTGAAGGTIELVTAGVGSNSPMVTFNPTGNISANAAITVTNLNGISINTGGLTIGTTPGTGTGINVNSGDVNVFNGGNLTVGGLNGTYGAGPGNLITNKNVIFNDIGQTGINNIIIAPNITNNYNLLKMIPLAFAIETTSDQHLYYPVLNWTGQTVFKNQTLNWTNAGNVTLAPGVTLTLYPSANAIGIPVSVTNASSEWSDALAIIAGTYHSYILYLS